MFFCIIVLNMTYCWPQRARYAMVATVGPSSVVHLVVIS